MKYLLLTASEILSISASVSSKIRDQLKEEEINIYQFPDCDSDEDEDFKRQDAEMKVQRQRRKGQRSRGSGCGDGAEKEVSAHEGPAMIPNSCPLGKHSFRSCRFMRSSEGRRDSTREGTPLLLGYRGG